MLFILAALAALAWPAARPALAAQKDTPAELLIVNARVHTQDPARPAARAVAVRGGRIVAVGDDLSAYSGPGTRRIDAQGRTLIPGLIDAHAHLPGLGDMLDTFDLRDVKSIAEVASMVRKAAAGLALNEWVRGRAWDQTNWGGKFPTAADLDAAAGGHPVYLSRVDGHAAWVNHKALEIAGVTRATADPAGGKIVRDAAGEPTGVLIDGAQRLVAAKIPAPTDEQVRRRLKRAAAECARLGLTGIHDAGIDAQTLAAYRSLIAAHELPLRIYAMIGGEGALWRQYLQRGPEIGERLTVRCIKLMSDGAMGSRGAAFWQPYADDPGNNGLLMLQKSDIERVARAAVQHGFQVATHAIGDRANRTVLDAYAAALEGKNDRRFRVEHAQIISLPDFELFQKYSIVASMQSTHATSDMRWARVRLGPDRLAGAYAQQKFLQMGVPLANGSDFPVESPNPLWGFYAAVTRQDHAGNPPGGWMPEQKLTRQQALASFTSGAAYAAFEEKDKGVIAPGRLADLVLLDRDILTVPDSELLQTKVRLTVLGGEIVYQAK